MSLFDHGKLCRCQNCITANMDATMFPATRGPWNMAADNAMRQARIKDPARYGNSSREDLSAIFEMSEEMGHEATDYQNPYLIVPSATLDYPAPYGTALDPAYALGFGMRNEQDVAINIRATQHAIVKGGVNGSGHF